MLGVDASHFLQFPPVGLLLLGLDIPVLLPGAYFALVVVLPEAPFVVAVSALEHVELGLALALPGSGVLAALVAHTVTGRPVDLIPAEVLLELGHELTDHQFPADLEGVDPLAAVPEGGGQGVDYEGLV